MLNWVAKHENDGRVTCVTNRIITSEKETKIVRGSSQWEQCIARVTTQS